jgi:hypothetical protein
MFGFLIFLLSVITYIVMAGVTHGYAKHRWPPKIEKRQVYINGSGWKWQDQDDNSEKRGFATILWPGYWIFVYPFTKANEVTFSRIEKEAATQIARNKARIEDLQATRAQVEASNAELEQAELELEKEVNKL